MINTINPLVANIMKAIYYAHTDFLNATIGTSSSFMWRSILASEELGQTGLQKKNWGWKECQSMEKSMVTMYREWLSYK